MTNLVVIGGGSGVASILRGIKELDDVNIKAIITVADNGGSTGRLKTKYRIPAVGDIRNVLVSLAESEILLKELMDFRFVGDSSIGEDVEGHSLGNLIIASLMQETGDFMDAIKKLESVLRIKGSIIPSTLSVVDLFAEMTDGSIVVGETNIRDTDKQINNVFYNHTVESTPEALLAIKEADYIIFGIGSLYTSIIPNIIVDDIRKCINESKAEVIYLSNIMSEVGETDGYTVKDHVDAIESHLLGKIDTIVYPSNEIPSDVIRAYAAENAAFVSLDDDERLCDYTVQKCDLVTFEGTQARHDSDKIKKWFKDKVRK